MPYVIVEYHTSSERSKVGDSQSDRQLMQYLSAWSTQGGGYWTDEKPRIILNKLEAVGYRLMAMTSTLDSRSLSSDQFLYWTLHKPENPPIYRSTVSLKDAGLPTSGSGGSSSKSPPANGFPPATWLEHFWTGWEVVDFWVCFVTCECPSFYFTPTAKTRISAFFEFGLKLF